MAFGSAEGEAGVVSGGGAEVEADVDHLHSVNCTVWQGRSSDLSSLHFWNEVGQCRLTHLLQAALVSSNSSIMAVQVFPPWWVIMIVSIKLFMRAGYLIYIQKAKNDNPLLKQPRADAAGCKRVYSS